MEGFTYATALDLNMGYYHIRLDAASKKLCTLVFPWGKYDMQCLPMGLCNSPDIFQEKMSELMDGLDYVRVRQRLKDAGLKVNAKKSAFAQAQLEYLG
jgi:hypothetical protein